MPKSKDKNLSMFEDLGIEKEWEAEWKDMPEFFQSDEHPYKSLTVHFENELDYQNFKNLINQKMTYQTKSIWYPKVNSKKPSDYLYIDGLASKYPIYIPSKGRWESRLTARALDEMNVPYRIVVEPSEYDNYASVISEEKILTLPKDDMKLIGSRCWIMEHSIAEGHARHWQLDDNINGFVRLNRNIKIPINSGVCFRVIEDFSDRYENVAYSGMNYRFFAEQRSGNMPAYYLNTRVYSCTLVNNSIPYRWRSIYNDDTDVSLMALKDGWCTVLFQALLCNKAATMTVHGGNTEQLYTIEDGRKKMAEALVELHPDVASVSWKWGRFQHHVDYSSFKQKLKRKSSIVLSDNVNEFGMKLIEVNLNKEK